MSVIAERSGCGARRIGVARLVRKTGILPALAASTALLQPMDKPARDLPLKSKFNQSGNQIAKQSIAYRTTEIMCI
ncbi:hypothetical protein H3V53_28575 [Paraburkholderia bengalensis]|uniref:Transposase n=1 Tax=Paraburkholderia bengalensis TaxID=2747562 RepID=A0ABU8IZH4_9BURK